MLAEFKRDSARKELQQLIEQVQEHRQTVDELKRESKEVEHSLEKNKGILDKQAKEEQTQTKEQVNIIACMCTYTGIVTVMENK